MSKDTRFKLTDDQIERLNLHLVDTKPVVLQFDKKHSAFFVLSVLRKSGDWRRKRFSASEQLVLDRLYRGKKGGVILACEEVISGDTQQVDVPLETAPATFVGFAERLEELLLDSMADVPFNERVETSDNSSRLTNPKWGMFS